MGNKLFSCAERLGKGKKEFRIKILGRDLEQVQLMLDTFLVQKYVLLRDSDMPLLGIIRRIKSQLAFFAVNDIVELYFLCTIIKELSFLAPDAADGRFPDIEHGMEKAPVQQAQGLHGIALARGIGPDEQGQRPQRQGGFLVALEIADGHRGQHGRPVRRIRFRQ